MDAITLYAEVRTNKDTIAKVVAPDTTWPDNVPGVDWVATEYPFNLKLAFPDMTLNGLELAAQHPMFKRKVEIALSKAIRAFIDNDFEVIDETEA